MLVLRRWAGTHADRITLLHSIGPNWFQSCWLRDTELSAWVRHTGQVDHKEEMQLDSDDPFLQSVSQASCRRSALSPDFASTNDPSLNVLEHLEIDACLTVHQVEAFESLDVACLPHPGMGKAGNQGPYVSHLIGSSHAWRPACVAEASRIPDDEIENSRGSCLQAHQGRVAAWSHIPLKAGD